MAMSTKSPPDTRKSTAKSVVDLTVFNTTPVQSRIAASYGDSKSQAQRLSSTSAEMQEKRETRLKKTSSVPELIDSSESVPEDLVVHRGREGTAPIFAATDTVGQAKRKRDSSEAENSKAGSSNNHIKDTVSRDDAGRVITDDLKSTLRASIDVAKMGKNFEKPFAESRPLLKEHYATKVSSPMDLTKLDQNLQTGRYRTLQEYKAAVHLIKSNLCSLLRERTSDSRAGR